MSDVTARVKFRLTVRGGSYYTVHIFRHKADMIRYQQDGSGDGIRRESTFEAICMSWRRYRMRGGRWHELKECGAILFQIGFMGAGVVAHELAHAAFRTLGSRSAFARREEAFCRLLGELVSKFWRAYWRLEKTHPWLSKV